MERPNASDLLVDWLHHARCYCAFPSRADTRTRGNRIQKRNCLRLAHWLQDTVNHPDRQRGGSTAAAATANSNKNNNNNNNNSDKQGRHPRTGQDANSDGLTQPDVHRQHKQMAKRTPAHDNRPKEHTRAKKKKTAWPAMHAIDILSLSSAYYRGGKVVDFCHKK